MALLEEMGDEMNLGADANQLALLLTSASAPGTKKRKAAAAAAAAADADGDAGSQVGSASGGGGGKSNQKKCAKCSRFREMGTFPERCNTCKGCRNSERGLDRLCEKQGVTDWWADVKATKPKTLSKCLIAYETTTAAGKARGTKRGDFDIVSIKEYILACEGTRLSAEHKMMWEGEYYEWAKGASAGFLSQSEAENNWKTWIADDKVAKDTNGPRDYKRVEIKIADKVSSHA
jgi:hypothetical protein